jgi:hypothetical protein
MSGETKREWAPCIHSKEDAKKIKPWPKKVLEADAFVDKEPDPTDDSVLERILWIIGMDICRKDLKDITFRFGADQWVVVVAELTYLDGTTERLRTEGDSFLLAMAKTLERLKGLPQKQGKS